MAPRDPSQLAGFADDSRQDGIARQAIGFVQFTGIYIGFACVTSRIDEESCLRLLNQPNEVVALRVVDSGACHGSIGNRSRLEKAAECTSYVAGTSKK